MSYVAVSQLFTGADIFIIPTFQRPYSWEEPQWEDLLRDVRVGTARLAKTPNALHYFGPIHTIKAAIPGLIDNARCGKGFCSSQAAE